MIVYVKNYCLDTCFWISTSYITMHRLVIITTQLVYLLITQFFFFFYELFIWSVFFRIHHCFITRKLDVTTIMMSRVLPMSFIRGHWLIMYGQQKLLNDMLRLFSVFLIVIYIFLLFLLFSYFIFLFFIISVYSVN